MHTYIYEHIHIHLYDIYIRQLIYVYRYIYIIYNLITNTYIHTYTYEYVINCVWYMVWQRSLSIYTYVYSVRSCHTLIYIYMIQTINKIDHNSHKNKLPTDCWQESLRYIQIAWFSPCCHLLLMSNWLCSCVHTANSA